MIQGRGAAVSLACLAAGVLLSLTLGCARVPYELTCHREQVFEMTAGAVQYDDVTCVTRPLDKEVTDGGE